MVKYDLTSAKSGPYFVDFGQNLPEVARNPVEFDPFGSSLVEIGQTCVESGPNLTKRQQNLAEIDQRPVELARCWPNYGRITRGGATHAVPARSCGGRNLR